MFCTASLDCLCPLEEARICGRRMRCARLRVRGCPPRLTPQGEGCCHSSRDHWPAPHAPHRRAPHALSPHPRGPHWPLPHPPAPPWLSPVGSARTRAADHVSTLLVFADVAVGVAVRPPTPASNHLLVQLHDRGCPLSLHVRIVPENARLPRNTLILAAIQRVSDANPLECLRVQLGLAPHKTHPGHGARGAHGGLPTCILRLDGRVLCPPSMAEIGVVDLSH